MGADASTLQGINNLDNSLESIEHRLFQVEDVYLRHENSVVLDDCIIVADKVVSCNRSVNLVSGPILGRHDSQSVKVGIEVNKSTTLEFHLFSLEKGLAGSRYVKSINKTIPAHVFHVFDIDGLDNRRSYIIYVGGISKKEVVSNILKVNPAGQNVEFYFTNGGNVGNVTREVENPWDQLAGIVSDSPLPCCKIVVHCGNLIDLSTIGREKVHQIIAYAMGNEFSLHEWERLIEDFENAVFDVYRMTLSRASLKRISQSCGIYFAVGAGESMVKDFLAIMNDSCADWLTDIIRDGDRNDNSISSRVRNISLAQDELSSAKSVFSKSVHSGFNSHIKTGKFENQDMVNIKSMVISLLARIVRKAYWLYFQQLWDEEATHRVIWSSCFEEKLSNMIATKRRIHDLSNLCIIAIQPENSELMQHMSRERIELHQLLIDEAVELGQFCTKYSANFGNVSSLAYTIGSHYLVLWDTGWSWISSNGSLAFPLSIEVEVGDQALNRIVNSISDNKEIGGIILVGRHILSGSSLSFSLNSAASFGYNEDMKIAYSDSKKLIDATSDWQLAYADRAALLVVPNETSSSTIRGTVQYSNNVSHRARIPFLLLGNTKRSWSLSENRCTAISRSLTDCRSNLVPSSVTLQNFGGYYRCQLSPETGYMSNLSSDSGAMQGRSAFYELCPSTIWSQLRNRFLIIVGQVTCRSAALLIESVNCCFAKIHCIDGISGEDHVQSESLSACVPRRIFFHDLHPNRNYDIFIDGSSSWANFTTCKSSRLNISSTDYPLAHSLRRGSIENVRTEDDHDLCRAFRILLVGGAHYHGQSFQSSQSFGSSFIKTICYPWNQYDLVLHGSCSVDWSSGLEKITSMYHSEVVINDESSFNHWKAESSTLLRNIFRMQVSGRLVPTTLEPHSGSHYFMSSAIIELLNAWKVPSFFKLQQDLTSPAVDHLKGLLDNVYQTYSCSLWSGYNDNYFGIRVIEEQRILLLELKPALTVGNRWLCREHYLQMKLLLADASLMNRCQIVIFVSPAPIVTFDPVFYQYSSINESQHDVYPHIHDTSDLLDFCADILMVGIPKDIVFICSHIKRSFSTAISFDQNAGAKSSIRQFCVGPLSANCEVCVFPKDGIISGRREYFYQHDFSTDNYSLCELALVVENYSLHLDARFISYQEIVDYGELGRLAECEKLRDEDSLQGLLTDTSEYFYVIWMFHDAEHELDSIISDVFYTMFDLLHLNSDVVEEVFKISECEICREIMVSSKLLVIGNELFQRLSLNNSGVMKRLSYVVVTLFCEWMSTKREINEEHLLNNVLNHFDEFKKVFVTLYTVQHILELKVVELGLID